MTGHEVWVVSWADGYYTLIVKQPHGGCYDVVQVGPAGAELYEEIAELPAGAVRLVEATDEP